VCFSLVSIKERRQLSIDLIMQALTQTINKQIEKEVILQAGKQNVGLKVVESKAKNNSK